MLFSINIINFKKNLELIKYEVMYIQFCAFVHLRNIDPSGDI